MPEDLKKELRKVARKYVSKGKLRGKGAVDRFVYGTMTNMQKRGEIPKWRRLR